jgi:hypothetical protein
VFLSLPRWLLQRGLAQSLVGLEVLALGWHHRLVGWNRRRRPSAGRRRRQGRFFGGRKRRRGRLDVVSHSAVLGGAREHLGAGTRLQTHVWRNLQYLQIINVSYLNLSLLTKIVK